MGQTRTSGLALWLLMLWSPMLAATELVLGAQGLRPDTQLPSVRALASFLDGRLTEVGIERVRVVLVRSDHELGQAFVDGRIDYAPATVVTARRLVRDYRARAELRAIDRFGGRYQSLFVTRKGAPELDLASLVGQRVAVRATDSTSSYYLPLLIFSDHGIATTHLRHHSASVPEGRVALVSAGNDRNIALWVIHGLVPVGVLNTVSWHSANQLPTSLRERLQIAARGDEVPMAVELIRDGLAPALRERLVALLLTAHESAEGRRMLEVYADAERFVELEPSVRAEIDLVGDRLLALDGDET